MSKENKTENNNQQIFVTDTFKVLWAILVWCCQKEYKHNRVYSNLK